jgi:HEAT repeat protein
LAICVGVVRTQPSNPSPAKNKADNGGEWIGPGDESIPVLMRYLRSQDKFAIRMALHDFATRGPKAKPAIPTIRALAKHPDTAIRIEAAWTLIDLNEEPDIALKTVTEAAKAKEASTRAYAAKALGEIVSPPFVICCWGPGPRPMTPRPAMAKQVEPALMELLKGPDVSVRLTAVEALVRIGKEAKAVEPILEDALHDKDARTRYEAGQLLRSVDKEAAEKAGVK